MFFDTNEIHIQAFVDFINGKLIIFQSSSPQKYFEDIYSTNIYKIYTKYIQNIDPKINSKNGGFAFRKFSKILIVRHGKIIFFQDVPIYFLICFGVFWYNKGLKYGVYGPRNEQ